MYCLLKANHKNNKWRGIEIKKGSFITSLETMKNETGLSIQQVRTCINRLKKTGEINTQSNKQNTVVTICKYDTYQSLSNESNTQANKRITNIQQTTNKQLTTNKNDNNIKNEKKLISDRSFFKIWNETRTSTLGKPSFLNRLSFDQKELIKGITEEDLQKALKGFFKQSIFPNGQDYTTNVKHFLNHFNVYLQAYYDKNSNIYGKES